MTVTDATAAGPHRPVSFGDLVRVPLRRWRVALAGAGVVGLGALGYLAVSPPTFDATSVVIVRAVDTNPFDGPSVSADKVVNMTAEAGIATGGDVLSQVARATRLDRQNAAHALEVEAPVGGQVLRFTFTGDQPGQAITGANTAAQAYLAVRRGMYEQQRAAALTSYDGTVAAVTKQRKDVADGLPATSDSPRATALLDQLRALNDQLAKLAEQRSKVATADLSAGAVTTVAGEPVRSSRDGAAVLGLATLLGGLIVGVVAAFVRDALDRRVGHAAEAAELTRLALLGTVAHPDASDGARTDLRYLALTLSPWIDKESPEPLVLLSGRDDEGRSEVSAGLAAALAEVGYDVYLGGTPENADRLRRVLLAAQRRAEPVVSRHRSAQPSEPVTVKPLATMPFPTADLPADAVATAHAPAEPAATPAGTTATVPAGPTATVPARTVPAGPTATAVIDAPAPTDVVDRPVADDTTLVAIGAGTVRLGNLGLDTSGRVVVVLDAPAARDDDRGVWAARAGQAVVVAARDHSRPGELRQLSDRLRAAGVQATGLVVVGGRP